VRTGLPAGEKVTSGGLLVSLDPEKVGLACAGRGWSLTELANRAGVSYPTLSAIMQRADYLPVEAPSVTAAAA
jgi:lambda repressor-like predicted transcriptional regulator